MTLLVILVVLAVLFSVGAVVQGLAWALLIAVALVAAAAWFAMQKLRGVSRSS